MFGYFGTIEKILCRFRGFLLRCMLHVVGGQCGPGLRLERGLRLRQGLHAGLRIGRDVYIGRNTTIDCLKNANLSVGNNVTLTEGVFISCFSHVCIGDDVLVGEYTSIRDANHGFKALDIPINCQPMSPAPITIGYDVWIGRGCAITAGVQIGEGCVIGANSVVTKQLPPRAIAFGAPAKPHSHRDD